MYKRQVIDSSCIRPIISFHFSGLCATGPGALRNEIIGRIQELSMTEIGIPCIYGLDQNHGTTYTLGGTLFPQNINMGAEMCIRDRLCPFRAQIQIAVFT